MLPERYGRSKQEFWLAYWYHELGPEGVELPVPMKMEWLENEVHNHVELLCEMVAGYWGKSEDPEQRLHRKFLSRAIEAWKNAGVVVPPGWEASGMVYDYGDLYTDFMPDMKRLGRAFVMVRHDPKYGILGWTRGEKKLFNRFANALGYEGKMWNTDTTKRMYEGLLFHERYDIRDSQRLKDLIMPGNAAYARGCV